VLLDTGPRLAHAIRSHRIALVLALLGRAHRRWRSLALWAPWRWHVRAASLVLLQLLAQLLLALLPTLEL